MFGGREELRKEGCCESVEGKRVQLDMIFFFFMVIVCMGVRVGGKGNVGDFE